jgi:lipoprotein-anchoring transpeptidase ErfK/SrfK
VLLLLIASFDAYLAAPYPPADGFDVPRAGVVRAAAHGRVEHVEPGVVVLEHIVYENHLRSEIAARYSGLTHVAVKPGDVVSRAQKIGEGPLVYQIERELPGKLFVPQEELVLVLVDQASRRLALYQSGKRIEEVEVGFGQRPGRKRRQGDLKTPRGMYFVVHKRRGDFSGPYGAYYGGHWIKINYPNAYDAEWGAEQKLIDAAKVASIRSAWSRKRLTDQGTPLGGGIGFHGWATEWSWSETGWLTWGCVVLHNDDVRRLFDQVPVGAMVVLM